MRRLTVLLTTTALAATPALAERVDDFELIDQRGVAHSLYYYVDGPAVVIMTTVAGDEAARAAAVELQAISEAYAERGVVFYLLDSSPEDTRADMRAEMEALGVAIPVLMDEHQLIGESLGVERAAEAFLIDPADSAWNIAYRGAIGDRALTAALDAVLAGEEPAAASAEDGLGAAIAFPLRGAQAEISYVDAVAPILIDNCVACHSPGGIAPWAMTSYDMVRGYSLMIREVLRTRRMPPYHADPHVGQFADARRLTPEQIKTLVHWAEAGAPRGEGVDPLLAAVKPAPEWPLGEPDLVVELPAFEVPATGVVDYQNPVIKNPLTEGRWLRASTVNVGSREAVHHLLSPVGGYAVGAESTIAPDNSGAFIEPGEDWRFQLHYTPFGRPVTDVTKVGLYFHDEPPELVNHSAVVLDVSIEIPPGAERHEEISYLEFPADAELLTAFPHAHYRGRSSSLTLRRPDGSEELLLSLPKYDFNWQRMYTFAEPIPVPAGSKLIARYEYDNSTRNRANPDPAATITWGEQSWEEMLYTAIRYRWVGETSSHPVNHDAELNGGRMFGMLDDNINDRLEPDELRGERMARLRDAFALADQNADGGLDHAEFAAVQAIAARGRSSQGDGAGVSGAGGEE